MIGGLLVGLDNVGNPVSHGGRAAELVSNIGSLAAVNMLFAMVVAQMLYGDLFNSRLCNALHAFPLRRESWFVTHTVAGLLFSFVPNLIISICFLPYLGEYWFASFLWLLGVTLEYLFFFGLATFSAMSTGKRFAMVTVYALVNFAAVIVYWFAQAFYEPLLYGVILQDNDFFLFCPVACLTLELYRSPLLSYIPTFFYRGMTEEWWYLVVLAVLGIALLGAALLLYRRRKLERAGDFMAFRWLKPVFSVVFTLSVGALFEMIGNTFRGTPYVFLTVGIIVGYFVGQMLLQRTVRVFRVRSFVACAAIGGGLVLSIALTAMDPLGVTRWTPNPDKVEKITLSGSFDRDLYHYVSNVRTITNPELIEDMVEIHQQILDEEKLPSNVADTRSIRITYTMSDGRQVERQYTYRASGQAAAQIKILFGAPEFVMGYVNWEDYLSKVSQLHVNGYGTVSQWYSGDQAKELLNAIRADCEAGTMDQTQAQYFRYGSVSITYNDGTSRSLSIYKGCENTVAWMKENFIVNAA